ncbi:MAG: HDIG domain-containing protein [Bacteroidetes bacterium]|nr:HDIG domain-containing protein [Bacteroidota bacterium]
MPNRTEALQLMQEWTANESLRKHMLCVETAMCAYAEKFGENAERWSIAGLLHDFDYERYPEPPDHPLKGNEVLASLGYDEEIRTAILGHAHYTNVPRSSRMAKALFACDELCGFIVACSLVKPDKKVSSVEVSSVRKKMKDKGFARNVSREDIVDGAKELEVELDEHIRFVLDALKKNAESLGL